MLSFLTNQKVIIRKEYERRIKDQFVCTFFETDTKGNKGE